MNKFYIFFVLLISANTAFAQINKTENFITITPKFNTNQTYKYNLTFSKIVSNEESSITEIDYKIPIQLTLYSEGEGFNLFEWKSQPMLFFKNNEDGKTYTFPTETVKITYRTDENYILGEVSNYDEVVQDYILAYQKLYNDQTTKYDDLASKSALYFIQMFHQFFGQDINTKNKENIKNLFFNPMKNTFSIVEDEVTYLEYDNLPSLNFVQKFNDDSEDNSLQMMNFKTIDEYRSQQKDANYKLKSWGNQTFQNNGLIQSIERVLEIKKPKETIHFIYTLTQE